MQSSEESKKEGGTVDSKSGTGPKPEPKPDYRGLEVVRLRSTRQQEFHDDPHSHMLSEKAAELESEYPDFLVVISQQDPTHPLNWSITKKIVHTCLYGLTTFAAQFGASVISPTADQLAAEFHVGREVGTLAFSCYVLGNMVGPVIFAPLSEIAGRKIGVFIPCGIAGIFMCIVANVSSIAALVVIRFIAGVFAAAPIVTSGGAMADMWHANHRAAAMALYASNVVGGSSFGPEFGALLTSTGSYGWRWASWTGGLLAIVISVMNFIFLSETYTPALEKARARDLRLDTGVWALHSRLDSWRLTLDEFIRVHCLRPIQMLATPIIFLIVMYSSFVYGVLFLAITTVGDSFERVYQFNERTALLPLIAVPIGFTIGGGLNVVGAKRYARVAQENDGYAPPEERLITMMLFGWLSPCGLFLYGWTMKHWIHWIVPCVGLAFMGAGLAIIFQGGIVYMVDAYTKYAASAIAANTMMRSIFGGVFPLFALQMYHKMNIHWASSLLGFCGVALWPVSWLFFFFGARIRQHDPFEKALR